MKTAGRIIKTADGGFSLIELIVVLAIISILLALAAVSGKQWIDKYNAEKQLRIMHADLLQTRMKAMEKNRCYFVDVKAATYQVIEDTNESGGKAPDAPGVDTYGELKPLAYQVIGTSLTAPWIIKIDTKGLIWANGMVSSAYIKFDTKSTQPEYDCLHLCATRITVGRMNGAGTSCVPK